MARNIKTILLKGMGHHDEGILDTAAYPGEAIRLASDGHYDPETLAAALAGGRGLKIVKENALRGKTVDDQYAADDRVFFYTPLPGDHVNVLVKTGESISVGDYLSVEGGGSGKFVKTASSATASYPVPMTSARVWDAMQTNLPGTAANDDMALVEGTLGTNAPTLQGVDFGGGSTDEKCAFEFILPPTYRAGAPITLRLNAGMTTAVSDGTCTVDAQVYKDAGDGTVGSDICATAAQSINSLTFANKDFTITPTGLVAGDRLIVRLEFGGSDVGNAAVMIPTIRAIKMLVGDAVGGQFEALESSGGALAADGLITCRMLNA